MPRPGLPSIIVTSLAIALAAGSSPAPAVTFHVDSTDDLPDATPGDGRCEAAGGACTLRAAVQEANALWPQLDTIVLPAGTYGLTIPSDPAHEEETGDLDVEDAVEIVGAGPTHTIVDGNYIDRIFQSYVYLGTGDGLVLRGMTLRRGGRPELAGGGIFNLTTSHLEDVVIRECVANTGGGFYSGGTLVRTVVTDNVAGACCAGIRGHIRLTLVDSTVSDNRTIQGPAGGIHTYGGTDLLIVRSTISGNVATGQRGGGLLFDGSHGLVLDSTISGNRADLDGGGIFRNAGYDAGNGGQANGRLELRNCTVTANVADADGSGSGDGGGVSSPTAGLYFRNTILAGNTDAGGESPDCDAPVWSDGHNLVQSTLGCSFVGSFWGDLLNLAPKLGPLADNGGLTATHALLPDSPALDAGHPMIPGSGGETCTPADQRGVPRPQPARCDMGAYEAGAEPCAAPRAGCTPAATRGSSLKLRRGANGIERLAWKWKGAGVAAPDFGNPLTSTAYSLCVFDSSAAVPGQALAGLVPPGACATKPCWKAGDGTFAYRNDAATPSGVQTLRLKAASSGVGAIALKGAGSALALPALPLAQDPTVVVQLGRLDGSRCWEARFGTATRNDQSTFTARSD